MKTLMSCPLVFLLGCSVSKGGDHEERARGLCYTAIERQAENAIAAHCGTLVPEYMRHTGDLPTRSRVWFHHRAEVCAEVGDAALKTAFCEGAAPTDWSALWQIWGAERLTEHAGAPPDEVQLRLFLDELGLVGDPRKGTAQASCNQDCRWWAEQTARFGAADELSLFYADTITLIDDMPARMVAWDRACSAPTRLPLCSLTEAATPAKIDAAWDTWTREAIAMQHRIHGLAQPDEDALTAEVYRVRRHFQLWGLPWSDRRVPTTGDGFAWVRSGR